MTMNHEKYTQKIWWMFLFIVIQNIKYHPICWFCVQNGTWFVECSFYFNSWVL